VVSKESCFDRFLVVKRDTMRERGEEKKKKKKKKRKQLTFRFPNEEEEELDT